MTTTGRSSSSAMKRGSKANGDSLSNLGMAQDTRSDFLVADQADRLACASATTGPCRTGNGGVFLSLCNMISNARQTFLPSNFTSIENITNSALPLILFETTPPPALPASSPVLVLKFESFTQTGLPSHFTLIVPLAVSDDFAMFGYGIGIGPPGAGVLQTSGTRSSCRCCRHVRPRGN